MVEEIRFFKRGENMKRICILGYGYGGIRLAKRLAKEKAVELVTIDRYEFHTIRTELHSYASGNCSKEEVKIPVNLSKNHTHIKGVAKEVDIFNKRIHLEDKTIEYDILIISVGSVDNYHGIKGAKKYAYSVQQFGCASKTLEQFSSLDSGKKVTVIGSGMTGVETASELAEARKDVTIQLVDRNDCVLKGYPEKIKCYAEKQLKKMGVSIIHNAKIEYINEKEVCNDGSCIKSDMTIWAAGIKPSEIVDSLQVEKDNEGRVLVTNYNQAKGNDSLYVIGDCASSIFPPSAQIAKQQANVVATCISHSLKGKKMRSEPFLFSKGTLGSLGNKKGIAIIGPFYLTGIVPRWMKKLILFYHKINP
jgi:NADH:ubiquinone reductase (H+-translocating)